MRILVLQRDYFSDLWRAAGHDVVTCGDDPTNDVILPGFFVNIETVLAALGPERRPDAIFWGDDSGPLRVLGLERCTIPKAMWSIDAHHHAEWHSLYADAFDIVFVAQSDYLPSFRRARAQIDWLPVYANEEVLDRDRENTIHDVSFVGTLDALRNPDRFGFLEGLGKRVSLHRAHGPYREVYRRSKIVVNQTVKGDLNFRIFQALACGSLLVTERTGNGLLELFDDGGHLLTYPRGDVDAATTLIRRHLADAGPRERIAEAGWRRVRNDHMRRHRAERVLGPLNGLVTERASSGRTDGCPAPHQQYRAHVSMSLTCLHLSHRMQEWSGVGGDPTADTESRNTLGRCYYELAGRYVASAGRLSPEDGLWRDVRRLMETEYGAYREP